MDKGEKLLKEKSKTLELINKIGKKKKLIFKNFKNDRYFKDINSDLDILVKKKDFFKWVQAFEEFKFKKKKHKLFYRETSRYQKIFLKNGFSKVDLTIHYDYNNFDYLSEEYLWSKKVSDNEKNIIIMSLAIIFKRKFINLNDYFLILNFIKKNNFSKKSKIEMKKYGWQETMQIFTYEIKKIEKNIGKTKFPYFSWKLFFSIIKFQIKKGYKFPFVYWAYFILAQIRSYILYKGHYLPFHVFWIPYNKLK